MNITSACLLGLLASLALPYACSPVYQFTGPRPFAGAHLHNPYATVQGRWQRANLHAHGIAWGGLTNGHQPSQDVVRTYRALGYDVAGISNYQAIAAFSGVDTPPIYEHGYNISKRHQLAIGARRVDWFDFPLWQWLSHEQFIIDRLGETADLVTLVHPHTRDAYSTDDLQHLTRYHLLEIVNGPFRSEGPWDTALSSGHPVWAIGNDDTHDTSDTRRLAAAWTMIDAPSAATRDVVAALKAGRSYAVARNGDTPVRADLGLDRVDVLDGTLTVSATGAPATFTFVGQSGAVRKVVKDATSASYTLTDHDSYIRTIVRAPQTTIYLNPVLRHDGRGLAMRTATVDPWRTWIVRTALAGALLLATWLLARRRARVPAPAPALGPLAQADRETA
jgi:hypothetical protein